MARDKEVCQLYRQSLRLLNDWLLERDSNRRFSMAVRRQFDKFRNETDPTMISQYKDAAKYLLWKFRHPEPYVYPTAPGGVAYDREPNFPQGFVKNGYNDKLETH